MTRSAGTRPSQALRAPDKELKFSGASFAPGYYGIGVRKEDVTLLAALNQAIRDLDADHTLEKIYRKYNVWDERQTTSRIITRDQPW